VIARLRRLVSLGPSEIALLRVAFFMLVRMRIAVWVLPWGWLTAPAARSIPMLARPGADRLEWAIRAASRLIPRATCLTQALALQRLLSRYGYRSSVQVGARNADGRFGAHAWVEYEGGSLLSSPAEIAAFARFFSWPSSQPNLP
jgi:hypothetical protein